MPLRSSPVMIISSTYRRSKIVPLSVRRRNKTIIMIDNVTQVRDGKAELGKLSSWSLFKAIKCTSKVTNHVRFNRETRRRLRINFFT